MAALPSRLSSYIETQKKRWGKSFVPTCFNNETKQSRSQPTGCRAAGSGASLRGLSLLVEDPGCLCCIFSAPVSHLAKAL